MSSILNIDESYSEYIDLISQIKIISGSNSDELIDEILENYFLNFDSLTDIISKIQSS